ncbi:MAG TPA: hypothetical protein VGH19_21435 [Verrucomicrobiae bacterium]
MAFFVRWVIYLHLSDLSKEVLSSPDVMAFQNLFLGLQKAQEQVGGNSEKHNKNGENAGLMSGAWNSHATGPRAGGVFAHGKQHDCAAKFASDTIAARRSGFFAGRFATALIANHIGIHRHIQYCL